MSRRIAVLFFLLALAGSAVWRQFDGSAEEPGDQKGGPTPPGSQATPAARPKHHTEALRGKVVWLADALRRRYGIDTDADAAHAQVALDGDDGLWPIVKDFRGRAFHVDPRLRDVDLELLVRRYDGSPVVQVVRVYTLKPDGKYELDYWCDVCAIAMYELKECECCQGPIRIRERRVTGDAAAGPPPKTRGTGP